ncbi:unnamed protein product [Adineta steineri]|uniref:G-protein coupled receptors family 1 profile domain-containing protein n=1 Tax=Adineta steineri TaxID=433720 RepID=A0A813V9T8_9BILA|nr:unnamed protein product [Adineta steineri]CAF1070885.1 unnamed protein product [Adineta steineri]CAF1271656.1 unnamed protein product [Adineta steineri]
MSNSSYVSTLILNAQLFSSYSTYIEFAIGLIGNIFNILVFTNTKIFHQNRCAFYLVAESIFDIGQLTQNFANTIWALFLNGNDPTTVSLTWCKLRSIFPQWYRLMLSAIVCFAAIDQFLSTHHRPYLRQLSSLTIARYQVYFATGFCLLHTIPAAVFLQISPIFGCIVSSIGLINYYSYAFYPIINGLFPICVSSLFSILAYRNVRHIVRRQIPINRRRLDQQLTAIIFVRVIFYVILQLPFTIYRIYSLNMNIPKGNTIAYAIDRWIQAVVLVLAYLSHAINFYIFLLTSSRYRRQVRHFIMKTYEALAGWCCNDHHRVHPLDATSCRSGAEFE